MLARIFLVFLNETCSSSSFAEGWLLLDDDWLLADGWLLESAGVVGSNSASFVSETSIKSTTSVSESEACDFAMLEDAWLFPKKFFCNFFLNCLLPLYVSLILHEIPKHLAGIFLSRIWAFPCNACILQYWGHLLFVANLYNDYHLVTNFWIPYFIY